MTTQGLFTVVRPAIDSDRIYLECKHPPSTAELFVRQ
jgi:hypothetical protein